MRWDLTRSGEISLDLDEISLDLLDKLPKYENLLPESENLKSESGKSRRNLENRIEFWKILPDSGIFLLEILSTSVGSGFFRFWEENRDRPAGVGFWNKWPVADRWLDRVGRFRVRSGRNLRVGRFVGLDGQPYWERLESLYEDPPSMTFYKVVEDGFESLYL